MIMNMMNDGVLVYWLLLAVPVVALVGVCAVLGERARGKAELRETMRMAGERSKRFIAAAEARGRALQDSWLREQALERLKSSANGVTISCELVGGPCDGAVLTVSKDAEWTWATESRADGSRVVHLYRFASRCNKRGLWVFDYASAGVKVTG